MQLAIREGQKEVNEVAQLGESAALSLSQGVIGGDKAP